MRLLRPLFFVCLIFASCSAFAQDDTVGFWQVSCNGVEIRPVTFSNEATYFVDSLSDSAKFNVFYFTESACKKCLCKLQVRDENTVVLKTIERKGYGDNTPFKFSGAEIKQMMGKGKIYVYFAYKYDGWGPWLFIGAVRRRPDSAPK